MPKTCMAGVSASCFHSSKVVCGYAAGCIFSCPAITLEMMLQPFFKFSSSSCNSQSLHKQSLASSTLHFQNSSCLSARPSRTAALQALSIAACSRRCKNTSGLQPRFSLHCSKACIIFLLTSFCRPADRSCRISAAWTLSA